MAEWQTASADAELPVTFNGNNSKILEKKTFKYAYHLASLNIHKLCMQLCGNKL